MSKHTMYQPESKLRDFKAEQGVGVQIGHTGHKLWVCVDGECVLRARSPQIELDDMRQDQQQSQFDREIMMFLAKHELQELVSYDLVDDQAFEWTVNCGDVFSWACADCEAITAENFEDFKQAVLDGQQADSVTGAIDGANALFPARMRKLRPQGAAYPKDNEDLRVLLNACGPEREIDVGNPYSPEGEYLYKKDIA